MSQQERIPVPSNILENTQCDNEKYPLIEQVVDAVPAGENNMLDALLCY